MIVFIVKLPNLHLIIHDCNNSISICNHSQVADAILTFTQEIFPILPILICSITSTTVLLVSKKVSKGSKAATKMKNDATITIVLVTVIYICCNIPAVFNYAQHLVAVYTGHYFLSAPEGSSAREFLDLYFWVYSYVIMVALNSLANPILYTLRMRRFRSDSNQVQPSTTRCGSEYQGEYSRSSVSHEICTGSSIKASSDGPVKMMNASV